MTERLQPHIEDDPEGLSPLLVLFGKPGAGKDTISNIFQEQYGYYVYHADTEITYKEKLQRGEIPTTEDRDQFLAYKVGRIQELQKEYEKILMNWAFVSDRQRQMFTQAYPQAQFILVQTDREQIEKRLHDAPRKGHNLTTELALKLGDVFEEPTIPHDVINNNGWIVDVIAQIRTIATKK